MNVAEQANRMNSEAHELSLLFSMQNRNEKLKSIFDLFTYDTLLASGHGLPRCDILI